MPASGSGSGTPIPPITTTPTSMLDTLSIQALSLAEYAAIIGYDECAFFGVSYDGQTEYDCRTFWTEYQRMDVYRALMEAQQMMEDVLGYPLCPTWIAGAPEQFGEQRYVDTQELSSNPLLTKWGHIIAAGGQAESTLQADATVTYSVEPATVGPLTVTISDTAEVKVFYPGTDREIKPQRMTYSGGQLTIYIPRCRLVETPNTTDDGMAYTDTNNFLAAVDVKRIYNDPSVAATLVAPHQCSGAGCTCSTVGCSEYTQTACMYTRDKRLGVVDIVPATYSAGAWTRVINCGYNYELVRLNYQAGLRTLDTAMKSALVRLAHARMASEPCGCDIVQRLWERDRKAPDVLSRERLNCPFGPSEGAWVAYKLAQSRKLYRMNVW
jgi:hypothetical protein